MKRRERKRRADKEDEIRLGTRVKRKEDTTGREEEEEGWVIS